jgi:enoyl-CoA hydratase/carnithine racemase
VAVKADALGGGCDLALGRDTRIASGRTDFHR